MTGSQGLSVLRAVLTRWTSHFIAYCRLEELRLALQAVVKNDEQLPPARKCIMIGDARAKAKASTMIAYITDGKFWDAIVRYVYILPHFQSCLTILSSSSMKRHLRPLALAANISQAAHIRPDQILLIFAMLYAHFDAFRDEDEALMRAAMLEAIEARWQKIDQDVFIATVILNPFHIIRPFRPLAMLTKGAIFALFSRLWMRFSREAAPVELWQNTTDYLDVSGDYATMRTYLNHIRADAEARVSCSCCRHVVQLSDIFIERAPGPSASLGGVRALSRCTPSNLSARSSSSFDLRKFRILRTAVQLFRNNSHQATLTAWKSDPTLLGRTQDVHSRRASTERRCEAAP